MTIKELIDKLNQYPKDTKVVIYDPVEDIVSDVEKVSTEDDNVVIEMEP